MVLMAAFSVGFGLVIGAPALVRFIPKRGKLRTSAVSLAVAAL
jgi:hypothetical protein